MNVFEFSPHQPPQRCPTPLSHQERLTHQGFVWLDFTLDEVVASPKEWADHIQQFIGFEIDDLHIADILNQNHPSVFDLTDEYVLLIFRNLALNELTPNALMSSENTTWPAIELHTTPVVFIFTHTVLITVQAAGQELFDETPAVTGSAPQRIYHTKAAANPLDLCLRLLNALIDHYLALRAPLTQRLQYWQNELLQGHRRFNRWSLLLHENIVLQKLESLCDEQIDALQALYDFIIDDESNNALLAHQPRKDLILVRVRDLLNHVNRVENHAFRLQAAFKSAVDLHFSALTNQTNETMRFLAIVTCMFAPLTLITGVYGMNFDVIPGLHNPYGFWLSILVMSLTTLGLFWIFHRRGLVGRGQKSVLHLLTRSIGDWF